MSERKYCASCGANVYVGADNACPYCKRDVTESTSTRESTPAAPPLSDLTASAQTPEVPSESPETAPAKGEVGYAAAWQPPDEPWEPPEGGTAADPQTPTILVPDSPFGSTIASSQATSEQELPRRKGRKGAYVIFTLIVVLVGLAIVGGLVYIFGYPIYEESRAEADEATCFSNQRIIEGAALVYAAAEDLDSIEHLEGRVWENVLVPTFIPESPVCPSGGSYFMLASGETRCETGAHGHHSWGPGGSAEGTETPTAGDEESDAAEPAE